MKVKFAFFLSIVALIFGCLAVLDLVVGGGVEGWLFTISVIGFLVSVPLTVVLEQITK